MDILFHILESNINIRIACKYVSENFFFIIKKFSHDSAILQMFNIQVNISTGFMQRFRYLLKIVKTLNILTFGCKETLYSRDGMLPVWPGSIEPESLKRS
uniref:Uncharacterized protein n=1 Tax=Micrurus corallinus TaxID=54390 RepID=A0A2D4ERC7_MICCO